MNESDEEFHKPKPLKLNKESAQPSFKKTDDTPAEPVVQHFKPIKKPSPYGIKSLLGLLIPIAVTAALGFGGYKGVMLFRDVSARSDEAERTAGVATAALMKMKVEKSQFENKAAEIDRDLPQLTDRIRSESRSKAESKFREPIATATIKLESVRQDHAEQARKKQEEAEKIANDKVARAHAELEKATKELEAATKENEELKVFLRANNRTQHGTV